MASIMNMNTGGGGGASKPDTPHGRQKHMVSGTVAPIVKGEKVNTGPVGDTNNYMTNVLAKNNTGGGYGGGGQQVETGGGGYDALDKLMSMWQKALEAQEKALKAQYERMVQQNKQMFGNNRDAIINNYYTNKGRLNQMYGRSDNGIGKTNMARLTRGLQSDLAENRGNLASNNTQALASYQSGLGGVLGNYASNWANTLTPYIINGVIDDERYRKYL